MSCDPDFGDVGLLLHFEGNFDDSSSNALVATQVGAPATTAINPIFGVGSLVINAAAGDYLEYTIAPGGPIDITNGDFTIEFFVRASIVAGGNSTLLVGCTDFNTNTGFPSLFLRDIAGLNIGSGLFGAPVLVPISPGVATHIAITRNASQFDLWVDGIGAFIANNANPLIIAAPFFVGNGGVGGTVASGVLDEVRVTKGLARYTANFTPPTQAFGGECAVDIPDVTGLPIGEAETELTDAGFTIGTITPVPGDPPGTVVSQNPTGSALPGTPIDLVVTESGVIPNFLDDEAIGGAYFGGVLNLIEFVYLPERTPFLEGAANLIINRYKQEPTDNRQRGVDYTFFLVPGETIQTVAVTGISAQGVLQANTDPVVTPLVITNLLLDPSGLKFAYSTSGGQNGVEYTVQFTTTTQIQTSTVEEIFSINILVEDSFP